MNIDLDVLEARIKVLEDIVDISERAQVERESGRRLRQVMRDKNDELRTPCSIITEELIMFAPPNNA